MTTAQEPFPRIWGGPFFIAVLMIDCLQEVRKHGEQKDRASLSEDE